MVRTDEAIEALEDGPCTTAILDGESPRNARPVREIAGCFRPTGHNNAKAVFYLRESHSAVEVLEKFLQVNEDKLSDVPDKSLYHQVCNEGDEWLEAAREVIGTEWHTPPEDRANQGPFNCPFCSEQVGLLSSHIANEHDGSAIDQ